MSMEALQSKASRRLDALFRTGYPHAVNIFAALMLAFLPLLSWLSGEAAARPLWARLAGVLFAWVYLVVWSRISPTGTGWHRGVFHELYLLGQTIFVAGIYALDGGLTRLLFVVVAVQAVYLIPARRWAPFVGTVAALWLALYLAITPPEVSGANMVASIGMYLLYLVFAALVTFTMVQQERQSERAKKLLEGVDQRHQALREYDLTIEHRTESAERERLAQTIHARLIVHLVRLQEQLSRLLEGRASLSREAARTVRLDTKAVLGEVREAVRTLRPGEEGADLGDEDAPWQFDAPPEPELPQKVADPGNLYHIWNLGVIIITAGVMIASKLVGGDVQWLLVLLLIVGLLAAYGGFALVRMHYALRSLCVVVQAGLIFALVYQTREPLMNHLFLVISGQMVLLMPLGTKGVASAVAFPTLLTGGALYLADGGLSGHAFPFSLTAAFGVTYFFGAVMAYMTRRQLEARTKAIQYAQQLQEVNRLLEARLAEARQVAIARERVRMAREIHDGMGHHLTTVIVDLQNAEALADEDKETALTYIRSAIEVIGAAMRASQEMVDTLDRFDRPLASALHELSTRWMKATAVPVFLRIHGESSALSTAARITLFRCVQESLTNVQKHARATRVDIILTYQADRVSLQVLNDDQGGAAKEEAVRSGFGLIGLRERAEALQGEFVAEPRRTGGFQVSLVLPIGL